MNKHNPENYNYLPRLKDMVTELQTRINELSLQDPFTDYERVNDNAAETDADEEASHDRVKAQIDELTDQLTRVKQAIGRVDEGTYGLCINCHHRIGAERLQIIPETALCIVCESRQE